MTFSRYFRLVKISGFLSLVMLTPAVFAQERCEMTTAVHSSGIVQNAAIKCCGKAGRERNKCLQSSLASMRSLNTILDRGVVRPARKQLREMKQSGCGPVELLSTSCSTGASTTVDEATFSVQDAACGLTYSRDRKQTLRKLRRSVRRAQSLLGAEYVSAVRTNIRGLLRSESCGRGGEQQSHGCSSIQDPRDGYKSGNVYKLSDHSPHYPVFITHNGSRSGTAITYEGERLDTLTYTGLANADAAGLRHHYRINRSCRSLPSGFYIKLGGTCYDITAPCSRID